MSNDKTIAGEMGQGDRPNWEPLEAMVGEELAGEFMWMFQVDLADGTAVHAYKHIFTRRYLHLAEDGRTFAFTYQRSVSHGRPLRLADGGVRGVGATRRTTRLTSNAPSSAATGVSESTDGVNRPAP